MNKQDLQNFKALFTEMRNKHLAKEKEIYWDSVQAGDEVDNILRERDQQLEYKLQGRESIFLKKIDSALTRIDEGTFGECQDCGADIKLSRLQARPTANVG